MRSAVQIKFRERNWGYIYSGILVYDDEPFVICGHCGNILKPNEIEIIERYNYWVDLSDAILD